MNAKTVATRLNDYLNINNQQTATVRVVNARWIYVADGGCRYYLNAPSVTRAHLDELEADLNNPEAAHDAYSYFCQSTDAVKFDGLSARSKRDALATLGDDARNTSGW